MQLGGGAARSRIEPADWAGAEISWQTLLPEVKLEADAQHDFEQELQAVGAVTHVRISIYPDGGISRLRLVGTKAE